MSKLMGRRHLGLLVVLMSGFLAAACGQTSKKVPAGGAGGASGTGGVTGHLPDAGATGGGTTAGSGGQAGASAATGGAVGSGGGAVDAATSDAGGVSGTGTGGAGGVAAGTAGAGGGGGKGAAVEPYFHAGTRLKPRVFRAGDLEVLAGDFEPDWFDVKTGERCLFRVGADGVERCLPDGVFTEDESDQLNYLDAACTHPALPRGIGFRCGDSTTAGHYFTVQPASGCNYRTYRLGAARPSTTALYAKSGASCRRLPASANQSEVVPLEEEVPLETFVAVKRVSRPRHPRMNALVREGEDGSSEIVGFSDPAHDAPCYGVGLNVSPPVCVPGWAEAGGIFSDATCMQPVGFDLAPRCVARTPTVLLQLGERSASCPPTQPIQGLWQSTGARSTKIFQTLNAGCESTSDEPTVAYGQGAAIDVASLPKLDVIEVGNGPLKLAFYGFDGVPFLPAPRAIDGGTFPAPFVDVARGEPCWPRIFADGTLRCVPSSFQDVMDFNLYYESEDCTGTRAHSPSSSCWAPKREPRGIIVQTVIAPACQDHVVNDFVVTETLELGDKSSATWVSARLGGSAQCKVASNSQGLNLLKVGKALNPADTFVPIERKMKD